MKKSLLPLLVMLVTITGHSQIFKKLRNKVKTEVEYRTDKKVDQNKCPSGRGEVK